MRRRTLTHGLLPVLAGCAIDPDAPYLGGIGDPVRGAALNAPRQFGDLSRWNGDPAGAARAVADLEFLADALASDPIWAPQVQPTVLIQLRQARREARSALGVAPGAPGDGVAQALRTAATAIGAGSMARAEAALSTPAFTAGPRRTLDRLAALPRLPRAAEAAGAVAAELERIDRRR